MLQKNTKYLPIKDENGNLIDYKQTIFLKHFITKNFIEVGDYTYYDASFSNENPENFENTNVLYLPKKNTKLIIGKFCCLANKCKFIMGGAQHHLNSFTTYPLFWNFIYNKEVKSLFDITPGKEYSHKEYGDTIIGNDVWLGYDSLIMPGVKIGDGAIVGTRSVVTKDVAPYTIVAGNSAVIIRKRFSDEVINKLLTIKWWNWDIEKIMKLYKAIMDCSIDELWANS